MRSETKECKEHCNVQEACPLPPPLLPSLLPSLPPSLPPSLTSVCKSLSALAASFWISPQAEREREEKALAPVSSMSRQATNAPGKKVGSRGEETGREGGREGGMEGGREGESGQKDG